MKDKLVIIKKTLQTIWKQLAIHNSQICYFELWTCPSGRQIVRTFYSKIWHIKSTKNSIFSNFKYVSIVT